MLSDQKLVKDFLNASSESAFRRLYRDKTPHLYQMALRLTGHNVFHAEELVQEMWIIALRKLQGFNWNSTLKTWLTGILINLNRDDLRKENKGNQVMAELSDLPIRQTTASGYDLENALSSIPIGYRKVMILHDIEGYQHKEIGALLDISEGTSKSQLFQARKAMRHQLNLQQS